MPESDREPRSANRPLMARCLGAKGSTDGARTEAAGARPRVVLVAHSFPLTSETFIVDKLLGLLDRGWDVHLVAYRYNRSHVGRFPELAARPDVSSRLHFPEETAAGEQIRSVRRRPTRERAAARPIDELGILIRSLRPQVVNFEFGPLARGLLQLGDSIGCKTIVSFRGYDIAYEGLADPFYYDEVWSEADHLHFVSHDLWQRAVSRGCPTDAWHTVITDAIDPDEFEPRDRTHQFGVGRPDRPFRILSVGRLVWKKGYEYGLQAIAQLVDEGIVCDYRVIGEAAERHPVLYTIHDLGLQDEVKLLGAKSHDEVKEEMLRADVFLHSSVSEGFAVSVIEAQAMELPVVCSDAEGLPENVADGMTGFVVPRRNAQALAEKLRMLALDADLRRTLGQAGRRRVFERFHIADQLTRFEEMYRQVADVRYRAARLSDRLLGEGNVHYPRSEENLLRLELAYADRLSAETD